MNIFRMTANQRDQMSAHLLPGDGKEAVAIGLCGITEAAGRRVWTVHKIIEVPHDACLRGPNFVTWPTTQLKSLIQEAGASALSVMKIHSHPTGYADFSDRDDRSDSELFGAVGRRIGGDHISAVLLPDGTIFGRVVSVDGVVAPIDRVSIVGFDLEFFDRDRTRHVRDFDVRHRQAFGDRTTDLLGGLMVGFAGVSGTGSPSVEMAARLGCGSIALIEPDHVEAKNLNRIYGATRADADAKTNKALMMRRHIEAMGLGTKVLVHTGQVEDPEAVALLSVCDVIFGCVDSVEGRDTLNRISTFHTVPYFDLGVRLEADGEGGVTSASASVHFIRPGGSSLKSRSVYDDQQLYAEHLRRTDPDFYADQVKRGYIHGVDVDRPAVVSLNTAVAAFAINELLARIHPFRTIPNSEFAINKLLFSHGRTTRRSEGEPDTELAHWVGRGQCRPLLMSGRLDAAA